MLSAFRATLAPLRDFGAAPFTLNHWVLCSLGITGFLRPSRSDSLGGGVSAPRSTAGAEGSLAGTGRRQSGVQSGYPAAMRDAIRMSIDHLREKAHKSRKVLVVVTDGNDNSSVINLEDLVGSSQAERGSDLRRGSVKRGRKARSGAS